MSGLKGGALLMLMGVPLLGLCALTVKDVMRTDIIASDPPADRGPSKDQAAAAHAKSSAWLSDVRKAATVSGQYRAAGPDDATADPAATGMVKASAARAADLNDLDLFLSEVERPSFSGRLKDQYQKWVDERKELKRDEQAVLDWLLRPPAVASSADAVKAVEAAKVLIDQYSMRSKFSDPSKAGAWRVRARLAVIDALAVLADSQYRAAVAVKLPLKEGNNEVKKAVETLRGLKGMLQSLNLEAKAAEEEKPLDATLRAAVDAKGPVADECTAREELLALFARDDLFTNASGAAAWLKQVGEQYRKTKDEKVRRLIREKVQEFCDAFIPEATRLDDKVVLKGKAVERKNVIIKFNPVGGKQTREPLSGDLDGVNEFNLADKRPGANTFVVHMSDEEYPRDLKPTELSKAAVRFNAARKQLADSTTAPRWTAKSVEELKKKCDAQKDLVDQLQTLGSKSVGGEPKIWTRLTGLADGMAADPDLFGGR
jgi:hypothetical protein